jgi:hypothetical protein
MLIENVNYVQCSTVRSVQQHLRQNQSEQQKKLNNSNSSGDTEVLQRVPGAPCDCGAEAMLLEV